MRSLIFFFFSSRRRHTRCSRDWSSDVCSSDLPVPLLVREHPKASSWRPVGTGNDEHVEPTIEALEGGAHVFVEKPMAFRVDQARARVESAERHGVRLGVDYNHRFSEPYRRALVFRDEGALGEIAYIDMKFAGDLYKDL